MADILVDIALACALVWVARGDLLRFRIANGAMLGLAAAFVAACLLRGRGDLLLPHGLLALGALILLMGAFSAGILGGGDAKFLTVALLWIGPEGTFAFAVLLLPATLIYAAGARLRLLPARGAGGPMRIPLGPCIAAAWIGVIALTHLFVRT